MKIRIVVDDKLVSVDQCVIFMQDLDWGHKSFIGDPNKKWDDVSAVQFDTARGQGHIEMITVETDDPDQPDFRAADRPLNAEKFERLFGWVLSLHAARKVELEAERAKAEEEALRTRQEAEALFIINNDDVVASRSTDALAAEMEDLRAQNADLASKVNAMLQAAKDVGGEAA